MIELLYIILYFLGGILTVTHHYYITLNDPELADMFLFIFWPVAVILTLFCWSVVGPVLLSHYIAKRLRK